MGSCSTKDGDVKKEGPHRGKRVAITTKHRRDSTDHRVDTSQRTPQQRSVPPAVATTAVSSGDGGQEGDVWVGRGFEKYTQRSPALETVRMAHVHLEKGQPLGVVWEGDEDGSIYTREVDDFSPAASAGIVPGWRLLDIDGVRVRGETELTYEVDRLKAQGGGCLRMVPTFTLQQVRSHNTEHNCWMIIADKVYDVTSFLNKHPGGKNKMLQYAGKPATDVFNRLHSNTTKKHLLPRFFIGYLRMQKQDANGGNVTSALPAATQQPAAAAVAATPAARAPDTA